MLPRPGQIAAALAAVLIGCGSEAPEAEVKTVVVPARARSVETPPALADPLAGSAAIDLTRPRAIARIWDEVLERREQIGALLETEHLLVINEICARLDLLLKELAVAGRDFERERGIEFHRALVFGGDYIAVVDSVARAQIPGRLPLALWEMDGALVAIEELLPEARRGDSGYPRPSERPPV